MILRRDPLADAQPLIRRVYAYVAYRLGDGPDAEDVTSETFERALRYRKSYEAGKGEPVAWLIGIARRCIEDERARRAAQPHAVLDIPSPHNLEEDAVRRLTIHSAISCLSERDRELIALRYGADLSVGRIAELFGLRRNAAEVALHRAAARLRAVLGEPGTKEEGPRLADLAAEP